MIHRVRDRRSHACHADFANAAGPILVHDQVGVVEKGHIQIGQIGAGGHNVVGKVVVDRLAGTWVVNSFFEQAHAYAHHRGAQDLIGSRAFVDDASAIEDGE